MFWRFFQCLQKSVKSCGGKHMHLINNINLVFSNLRRDSNLINQIANIVNGIVGCGIQFENVESEIFAFLFIPVRIYFFGKNSCTGCFSNATWSLEKHSMGKMFVFYGVFKSIGNCLLPNNVFKNGGAVLSG